MSRCWIASKPTWQATASRLATGPSERELALDLGISRPAVCEALRIMEAWGTVVQSTGSGPEADTVFVGCPACMMQLLDNVSRFGNEQKVSHYISLLADSYRKEKEAVL